MSNKTVTLVTMKNTTAVLLLSSFFMLSSISMAEAASHHKHAAGHANKMAGHAHKGAGKANKVTTIRGTGRALKSQAVQNQPLMIDQKTDSNAKFI